MELSPVCMLPSPLECLMTCCQCYIRLHAEVVHVMHVIVSHLLLYKMLFWKTIPFRIGSDVGMLAGCCCKIVVEGLLRAGALPLCAPAADGDARIWCQLSPDCQQISHQGTALAGMPEGCAW